MSALFFTHIKNTLKCYITIIKAYYKMLLEQNHWNMLCEGICINGSCKCVCVWEKKWTKQSLCARVLWVLFHSSSISCFFVNFCCKDKHKKYIQIWHQEGFTTKQLNNSPQWVNKLPDNIYRMLCCPSYNHARSSNSTSSWLMHLRGRHKIWMAGLHWHKFPSKLSFMKIVKVIQAAQNNVFTISFNTA